MNPIRRLHILAGISVLALIQPAYAQDTSAVAKANQVLLKIRTRNEAGEYVKVLLNSKALKWELYPSNGDLSNAYGPSFVGLPVQVEVRAEGYQPTTRTFVLKAGPQLVDVVLKTTAKFEEEVRFARDARAASAARGVDASVPQGGVAQATLKGTVRTDNGVPIAGAMVYVNDLSVVDTTKADGVFNLRIAPVGVRGQLVNLRVRALGHAPGVQVVKIESGTKVVDFFLMGEDRARQELAKEIPVRALEGPVRALPAPMAADPFSRNLFPPELLMRHQDELGLTERQRMLLQGSMEATQKEAVKLQWALALENEKFSAMIARAWVNESDALDQLDKILSIARDMQRAQFISLLSIKNLLTPEQQNRLRELRARD